MIHIRDMFMKPSSDIYKFVGATMILLTSCTGCASMIFGFSAESITATVVDAESNEPLQDVIVVAQWELRTNNIDPGGSQPAGPLKVMETVTDDKGQFHFPDWGPIYKFGARMLHHDPELLFFKPDYKFKTLVNSWSSSPFKGYQAFRSSDWDGKTIKLEPFRGSEAEYAEMVKRLDDRTDFARRGKNCEWKSIPKLLSAIDSIAVEMESQGVKLRGWNVGVRIRRLTDVDELQACDSN